MIDHIGDEIGNRGVRWPKTFNAIWYQQSREKRAREDEDSPMTDIMIPEQARETS